MRQYQVQQQLEQLHQQQLQQQKERERQLREQEEKEKQKLEKQELEKQQQLIREQEERARQLQQLREQEEQRRQKRLEKERREQQQQREQEERARQLQQLREQEEQKRQERLMREREQLEKERREKEQRERQNQIQDQVWGQPLQMEQLQQWSSTPEPLLPPQLSSLFTPNVLPPSPSQDEAKHSQHNTDSAATLVFPSAIVDENSPENTSSANGNSLLTQTTVSTTLSSFLASNNMSKTQANSDPFSKLLGSWSGPSFSIWGGAKDSSDSVGVSMLGGTPINEEETEGSKIAPIGTPQHQPSVPKQSPVDQSAPKDDFYTVPANTNSNGSTAELQVGMDSTVSDSRLEPFAGDKTSETTLIFERDEDGIFSPVDNLITPRQEVSQPPWDCWPTDKCETMLNAELIMNPTGLDPSSHGRMLDSAVAPSEVKTSSPLVPPTTSEIELPSTSSDSTSPDMAVSNTEDDFKFLIDCFPHTKPGVLEIIYKRSNNDITRAVEDALHIQMESDTESSISSEDQQSLFDSWDDSIDLDQSFSSEEDFAEDTNTSIQEGQIIDGEAERSKRKRTFIEEVGYSDAEYAQMLQDQIDFDDNKAGLSEKGSQDSAGLVDGDGTGMPDDNLQLKLSVSLGAQLQRLYGSVEKYLLCGGTHICTHRHYTCMHTHAH